MTVCCTTIQPFPSESHSAKIYPFWSERPPVVSTKVPFAVLCLSHSQSLTMASYFQVGVPSHRPHEIVKSSMCNTYDCLSLANHGSSKYTLTRFEPKTVNTHWDNWRWMKHKTANFQETTGYDSKHNSRRRRLAVVLIRMGTHSPWQSVTRLGMKWIYTMRKFNIILASRMVVQQNYHLEATKVSPGSPLIALLNNTNLPQLAVA